MTRPPHRFVWAIAVALPLVAGAATHVVNVAASGPEALMTARDRVRALRTTADPADSIAVVLSPGIYVLDAPLVLSTADSGVAGNPVVWRTAERGTVSIRGGCALARSAFGPVTDVSVRARLPDPDKVVAADISKLAPAGGFPAWGDSFHVPPMPLLTKDGAYEQVARWPDVGWANYTDVVSASSDAFPGGVFTTLEERAARWDFAAGVWLHGYFRNDWQDDYLKAGAWDPQTRNLGLVGKPTYAMEPDTGTRRYAAINLPEELDAPGEYWVDRVRNVLYYCPSEGDGELVLSVLGDALVKVTALAHDITFENIGFGHADRAVTTGRGVRRMRLQSCDFTALRLDAVTVTGSDNVVADCAFRHLGCGGVTLDGGDRTTLTAARNLVEGSLFEDFSHLRRVYVPGVSLAGCGQAVRNCTFTNAPHMAMCYSGNEHLIGWNDIADVLRETHDAGSIYSGRNASWLGEKIVGNRFHDFAGNDTTAVYFDDCDWGGEMIGNSVSNVYRVLLLGGGKLHRIVGNVAQGFTSGLHVDRRGMSWESFTSYGTGPDANWALSCYQGSGAAFHPTNNPTWAAAYPEVLPALAAEPMEPRPNALVRNLLSGCASGGTYCDLKKTRQTGASYSADTNGVDIAGNVTVSADGRKDGCGLDGFVHYKNRSADVALVDGLADLQARVAALRTATTGTTVTSPKGRLSVVIAPDVTTRLSCRIVCDGVPEDEPVPVFAAANGVSYGVMSVPCQATVNEVTDEKAVSEASSAGYRAVTVPLVRVEDGDASSVFEARVFDNGFAWRMTVGGQDVTGWRTWGVQSHVVTDGYLVVDVPQGTSRSLRPDESAALAANAVTNVLKLGDGTLELNAPLTGYVGAWTVRGGTLTASPYLNAFGTPGDSPICVEAGTNCLRLEGEIDVDRPVLISGSNHANQLAVGADARVRFLRPVTLKGFPSAVRPDFGKGSVTTVCAGWFHSGSTLALGGSGALRFADVPSTFGQFYAQGSLNVAFDCPSNAVNDINGAYATDGHIALGCDDALAGKLPKVNSLKNYALELNGHDLAVARLHAPDPGRIVSDRPATLFVEQGSAGTNGCPLLGAVSLEKSGGRELALSGVSTSTGALCVRQGVLRMLSAASWRTASGVTVAGGTLVLEGAENFGEKVGLILSGGAVDVPEGITAVFGSLKENGVYRPAGTYDGASLSALTGGGQLKVLSGSPIRTTLATAEGENFASASVEVHVESIDGARDGDTVRVTLTDAHGKTVGEIERPFVGTAAETRYTFGGLVPGRTYDCTVRVFGSNGTELTDKRTSAALVMGRTGIGDWFSASAAGTRSAVFNGHWLVEPPVEDGAYRYGDACEEPQFVVEKGLDCTSTVVTVEAEMDFDGCRSFHQLPQDLSEQGALTLAQTDGQRTWVGLAGGSWRPLEGAPPDCGDYVVAMDFDYTDPAARLVRYRVRRKDEADFRSLTSAGEAWLANSLATSQLPSRVRFMGEGSLVRLAGSAPDTNVATVGGRAYASFAEALAASAGERVTLLTNACLAPDGIPTGDYLVDAGGYLLRWLSGRRTCTYRNGVLTVIDAKRGMCIYLH